MSVPTALAPFPGPQPFKPNEGDVLFGRDREERDLAALVLSHRAIVLTAPSGAGKTSLVQAKLIPKLTGSGAAPALRGGAPSPPSRFVALPIGRVSGETPVGSRNVYLSNLQAAWSGSKADTVDGTAEGLRRWALADDRPEHKLLVIDQFEELLTAHASHWRERPDFMRALADAFFGLELVDDETAELDPDAAPELHSEARARKATRLEAIERLRRYRLLFIIREDFVGALDRLLGPLPMRLQARMRIDRLDGARARLAVSGPIAKFGGTITPDALDKLVDDLTAVRDEQSGQGLFEGETVELVHLQVVCAQLWRDARSKKITIDDLGGSSAVDGALENFYAEAVRSVAADRKIGEAKLRTLVEQDLITPLKTRAQVVRNPDSTGLDDATLETLEKRKLLRSEPRAGAIWYELTHDRIIEPIRKSNAAFRWQRARRFWAGIGGVAVFVASLLAGLLLHRTTQLESKRDDDEQEVQEAAAAEVKAADREVLAAKADQAKVTIAAQELLKVLERSQDAGSPQEQQLLDAEQAARIRALAETVHETTQPEPNRSEARRLWGLGARRYAEYTDDFAAGRTNPANAEIARRSFERSIQADPTYAPPYNSLGRYHHDSGDKVKAETYYKQALARDPDYTPALVNYAQLLIDLGKLDDAEAQAQRAANLGSKTARSRLARIHELRGE